MKIDAVDIRILNELQADGSLTNLELAKRVHLSPSPCLTRVKALENDGVIDRYVALVQPKSLGLNLSVFISISLKEQSKSALAAFEKSIADHDEIMECYLMTGPRDYLLRVVVPDLIAYEQFIKQKLTRLDGLASIESSFALDQIKYSVALPL